MNGASGARISDNQMNNYFERQATMAWQLPAFSWFSVRSSKTKFASPLTTLTNRATTMTDSAATVANMDAS